MNHGSLTLGSWQMYQDRPVKLLERLDELKITRKAFADAAGVSERAVYTWLSYQKEPKLTFAQVASLCSLLRWTAEELADAYYPFGGSDSANPEANGGMA
jgi:DNA-binding XRE family transcriptional regulator